MKYSFLALLLIFFSGCKYDKLDQPEPVTPVESNFPSDIGNILVTKCATPGCHNSLSRGYAGGLDFSTWDLMFDGGRNGTAVIPYSTDNSYMLYSVNTDSTRGPVLLPTMPYLQPHISDAEYNTLVNWIANGAPNKDGFVKFSDDPNRKKLYICMQGCDKVAVIDEATKVIMRYISVGHFPNTIESPHQVRVSPDGQFWYVVFYGGDYLQKYRTSDDSYVGEVLINIQPYLNQWNTLVFSPDGSKGYVNGTQGTQQTAIVDLNNMTLEVLLGFNSPHGGMISADGQYLYLTNQNGNTLSKVNLSNYSDVTIPLYQGPTPSSLMPHEIILTPDGTRYLVSCQASNEVRVFQQSNDSLINIINVGAFPQEFALMPSMNKVFVSCMEQFVDANKKGSVYSIDLTTYATESVYTGYQPHGLAADDDTKLVYVTNLNADPNGPAPHHAGTCGGRNGNLSIIDATTMTMYVKTLSDGNSFQYKCETLNQPYYISLRK